MTEQLDVYAACVQCGADIDRWRELLLPARRGELVLTERGELGLRVQVRGACSVCEGSVAEIRVEARPTPGSSPMSPPG
jgi:hypothetical protein